MLPLLIFRSACACPSDLIGKTVTSVTYVSTSSQCTLTASDCLFQKISGTAICMRHSSSVVYISDCTFQNCYNKEKSWEWSDGDNVHGGACFILNLNSTITRCCGYECYCTCQGQFYFAESSKFHFSTGISTFMCGNEVKDNGNCQDVLLINDGNQVITECNFSSNEVFGDASGFEPRYPASLRTFGCSVVNCKGRCALTMVINDKSLSGDHSRNEMVNICNNTGRLIEFVGDFTLSHWIFSGNSDPTIVRSDFWGPNGSAYQPSSWAKFMTMKDCISDTELTCDNVNLENHRIEKNPSTLVLYHLQTYLCPGEATPAFTSKIDGYCQIRLNFIWVLMMTYTLLLSPLM